MLLALEIFSKLSTLKASYKRVEEGGPLWEKSELEQAVDEELEELENDDEVMGPLYFFLPLIILIVVTVSISIELGMLVALICQFIMYVLIKRIKAAKFFETMFAGFKDMTQMTDSPPSREKRFCPTNLVCRKVSKTSASFSLSRACMCSWWVRAWWGTAVDRKSVV